MQQTKFTFVLLLFTLQCFCSTNETIGLQETFFKSGIGFGSVIAIVISWERNKSVLYAILHGIFGWFYVGYYLLIKDAYK